MASAEQSVTPTPAEVVDLVRRLTESTWPTDEVERAAWFERHGIAVEGATLTKDEHGSRSFDGRGPTGWGDPPTGWHVFEDEFVGLHWFLWHGLGEDVVPGLADELRTGFVDLAGEPTEELSGGGYRFTANWDTGDLRIDMYLHGGPVLDGTFHEEPVVQLHVDHQGRSTRAEAAARATRPARPRIHGQPSADRL